MSQENLIKQWLDFKHMTQKELANKMGVSQSFISYYVNKKNIKYRYTTAEKFANAFEISTQDFLKGPNMQTIGESTLVSDEMSADLKNNDNLRLRIINIIMSSSTEDLSFFHDLLTRCIRPNE